MDEEKEHYEEAGTDGEGDNAKETEEPLFDISDLARVTSHVANQSEETDTRTEAAEEKELKETDEGNNLIPDEYLDLNIRTKEDGKDVVLPLKEVVKGYLRERKFTQRMMEISNVKAIADHLVAHPDEAKFWLDRIHAQKTGQPLPDGAPQEKKEDLPKGIELPDELVSGMADDAKAFFKGLVNTVNKQNETIARFSNTDKQVQQIQHTQQMSAEQREAANKLGARVDEAMQSISDSLGIAIDPKEFRDKFGNYMEDEGFTANDLFSNCDVPQWIQMHAERAYRDELTNRQLEAYKTKVNKRSPSRPSSKTPIRSRGTTRPITTKTPYQVDKFGRSTDPKDVTKTLAKLANAGRSELEER